MDPPTSSADSSAPSWSIPESVLRRQILLNRMQLHQHGVGTVTTGAMWQSGGEQGAASAALLRVLEGNSSSGGGGGGGGGGDALQELQGLIGAHLDCINEGGEEAEEETADGEAEGGGGATMRGGPSMEASYQAHADEDGEHGEEPVVDDEELLGKAGHVSVGGADGGSAAVLAAGAMLHSRHRPSVSVEVAPRAAVTAVGDLNLNSADASLRLLRSLVSALPQQQQPPSSSRDGPGSTQVASAARPPLFPPAAAVVPPAAERVGGAAPVIAAGASSGAGIPPRMMPVTAVVHGSGNDHQQCGPVAAAFSQRFPAYGVGLIDSLLVLDEQVGGPLLRGGDLYGGTVRSSSEWWGSLLRGGDLF